MSEFKMIFVDTETTGLSHIEDKIIEIGAIKVNLNGKIEKTFNELANPGFSLPEKIIDITKITDDMLIDKPPSEKIIDNFFKWCKQNNEVIFIAHSAKFDMKFLFAEFINKCNIPKYKVIDTLLMYRKKNFGAKNCKLETLSEFIGYKTRNSHRALDDAHACMKIFAYYISREYKPRSKENMTHIIKSISRNLQEFLPTY